MGLTNRFIKRLTANRAVRFFRKLFSECGENRIAELSVAATYRLVFASVPFLIFLMSLIGSLNIDEDYAASVLYGALPDNVAAGLSLVLAEALKSGGGGIISVSLIIALFSAANGFKAVIRGINGAYETDERRGFVKLWLTACALVALLALAIIATLLLFIFGDGIYALLSPQIRANGAAGLIFGIAGGSGAMLILLASVLLIYRVGAAIKRPVKDALPGAAAVLGFWLISSKAFNIYVNNFSRYSGIYGGVASIFIFMLWLNLMCTVILFGAQLNAMLFRKEPY